MHGPPVGLGPRVLGIWRLWDLLSEFLGGPGCVLPLPEHFSCLLLFLGLRLFLSSLRAALSHPMWGEVCPVEPVQLQLQLGLKFRFGFRAVSEPQSRWVMKKERDGRFLWLPAMGAAPGSPHRSEVGGILSLLSNLKGS